MTPLFFNPDSSTTKQLQTLGVGQTKATTKSEDKKLWPKVFALFCIAIGGGSAVYHLSNSQSASRPSSQRKDVSNLNLGICFANESINEPALLLDGITWLKPPKTNSPVKEVENLDICFANESIILEKDDLPPYQKWKGKDAAEIMRTAVACQGNLNENGKLEGWGKVDFALPDHGHGPFNSFEGKWKNGVLESGTAIFHEEYPYQNWHGDVVSIETMAVKKEQRYSSYQYKGFKRYEGSFTREGNRLFPIMEGKGRMEFDGRSYRSYEGDWVNNQMHGQGTLIFADGGKYEGELKEGLRNGQGTWTNAEGTQVFKGKWSGGSRTQGTLKVTGGEPLFTFLTFDRPYAQFATDFLYEGGWSSDQLRGHGCLKFGDGTEIEGEFEGNILSYGTVRMPNGDVYAGGLDPGTLLPHGEGKYTYKQGTIVEGLFDKGKFPAKKGWR